MQDYNQPDVHTGGEAVEQKKSGKERRGFASMDPQKQREIASKGGKAAHAKGTAHEFSSEEARQAGSKGGKVVSQNRDHMAEIGRKGGQARGERQH
jgi:general stress protein YciG